MGLQDLIEGNLILEFTWSIFSWCLNFQGSSMIIGATMKKIPTKLNLRAFLVGIPETRTTTSRRVLAQNATRPPCMHTCGRVALIIRRIAANQALVYTLLLRRLRVIILGCRSIFQFVQSNASISQEHLSIIMFSVRLYFCQVVYNLGKLLHLNFLLPYTPVLCGPSWEEFLNFHTLWG